MARELISFLPEKLQGVTLGELLSSGDFEISKKGNKTKITRIRPDSIISLEYTEYAQGKSLAANQVDITGSKRDRKETVRQMRKEGKTQAEIAQLTGMSQGYVSSLLRKKD